MYLQFGIGQASERKKVATLLDLIDVIPYENEALNEIMITSRWDVEKLRLLGIITDKVNEHLAENHEADSSSVSDGLVNVGIFGKFTVPPASRGSNDSLPIASEGRIDVRTDDSTDEVLSVSEYIEKGEFYSEGLMEALAQEQSSRSQFRSIDSWKGFNFLRAQSKYHWVKKEDGKHGLFVKRVGKRLVWMSSLHSLKKFNKNKMLLCGVKKSMK